MKACSLWKKINYQSTPCGNTVGCAAHPQHLAQLLVFGDGALAIDLTGLHIATQQVFAHNLKRHRNIDIVRDIKAVENIHTFESALLAVIEVPAMMSFSSV